MENPIRKFDHFFIVTTPSFILKDPLLDHTSILIYGVFMTFARGGICDFTMEELANLCRVSTAVIKNRLKLL